MTKTAKRVLWIGFLIALGFFAYSYFGSKGVISITSPLPETVVFLDNVKYRTLDMNETLDMTVDVGSHTILVSKTGYFPWIKEVQVVEEGKIHLSPFMLLVNPSGQLITEADPEHDKIESLVREAPLPIRESPRKSESQNIEIWAVGNAIYASWIGKIEDAPEYFCSTTPCDPIISVFDGAEVIDNLEFYKNREDVIMFSAGNGIFAIETDPRGTKNFQPIYTGTRPRFYKNGTDTLYVLDGEELAEISI